MAKKITINALGFTANKPEFTDVKVGDNVIKVSNHLTIEEQANLTSEICENVVGTEGFLNPYRFEVWSKVMLLKHYTNISFTEAQFENIQKTYEVLASNMGALQPVYEAMPQEEVTNVLKITLNTIQNIYAYENSVMGAIKKFNSGSQETMDQWTEVLNRISDGKEIEFVKELVEKMG